MKGMKLVSNFIVLAGAAFSWGCRSSELSELTRPRAADIITKSQAWTGAAVEFHDDNNSSILTCLSTRKLAIPIFAEGVLKPTERTEGLFASGKLLPRDNRWEILLVFKSGLRITEVTGITRSAPDGPDKSVDSGTEEVQFTWELNNDKSYGDLLACLPMTKTHTGAALIRLYDDGWRTEKVELKTF